MGWERWEKLARKLTTRNPGPQAPSQWAGSRQPAETLRLLRLAKQVHRLRTRLGIHLRVCLLETSFSSHLRFGADYTGSHRGKLLVPIVLNRRGGHASKGIQPSSAPRMNSSRAPSQQPLLLRPHGPHPAASAVGLQCQNEEARQKPKCARSFVEDPKHTPPTRTLQSVNTGTRCRQNHRLIRLHHLRVRFLGHCCQTNRC